MNASLRNARRLYEDASLLYENERYPSSLGLSCLSIEEAGKTTVLRGLICISDPAEIKKVWREFRSHEAKAAHWIVPNIILRGGQHLPDFLDMLDKTSDHREQLSALKEISFYVDCYGKGNWSKPENVTDASLTKKFLVFAETLSRSENEITTREIELWYEYMAENQGSFEQFLRWHWAMVEEGLTDISLEEAVRFVGGERILPRE